MSEQDLQDKYNIAPHRVEKLFKRMVATGAVAESELAERFPAHKAAISGIEQCRESRVVLPFRLMAYDITTSSMGLVRDISKTGLRVAGINCKVGAERSIQIPMEPFLHFDPVLLVAQCRWAKARGRAMKYSTAGFAITGLSERDGLVLKTLVESLPIPKLSDFHYDVQATKTAVESITPDARDAGDSKEASRWPPSWFDEEAMRGLQEIYRSGTLQEILAWWEARKPS